MTSVVAEAVTSEVEQPLKKQKMDAAGQAAAAVVPLGPAAMEGLEGASLPPAVVTVNGGDTPQSAGSPPASLK